MKQFKTLALIPAMLLAACGGDSDTQTIKEKTTPGAVVYSFPMDGQNDVSPKADIVLRFSHAVVDDEATLAEKIKVESDGAAVAFTVKIIDGGKSLKLEPATALARDRKSTRLNSSHVRISYAVFCLKKKNKKNNKRKKNNKQQ